MQLVGNQFARGAGIAVFDSIYNGTVFHPDARHRAAPQRQTSHKRQQGIEGRLADRNQQAHDQFVTRQTHQPVVEGQKLVKKLANTQSIVLERLKGLINLIK